MRSLALSLLLFAVPAFAQATDAAPVETTKGALLIALYGALLAVVVAIGSLISRLLLQRAQANKVWSAVNMLWLKAQTTVAYVEAAVRPTIQSALADGSLSAAETKEIQAAALKAFKEKIGDDLAGVMQLLGLGGGTVDAFLTGMLAKAGVSFTVAGPPTTLPSPNAPVVTPPVAPAAPATSPK